MTDEHIERVKAGHDFDCNAALQGVVCTCGLDEAADSLERELTELRAQRDTARDLFRAASKFEVKLTDQLTAAREVVEAARRLDKRLPCPKPNIRTMRRCRRCTACKLRTALSRYDEVTG